ncbi:MAG: hypothetical protein AAGF12_32735 [Myxococcota bacterium]
MIPRWVMQTLRSLRDVPGVQGSFVFAPDGRIMARDFPNFVADDMLEELAGRLGIIGEATKTGIGTTDSVFLSYPQHALAVYQGQGCVLAVLANPSTNPDTLQLGANIVLRNLAGGRARAAVPNAIPRPPAIPSGFGTQRSTPSDPQVSSGTPRSAGPTSRVAKPPAAVSKKKKKGIWE